MTIFSLSETDLKRLWQRSHYPLPTKGKLVIFGLRGLRPVDYGGTGLAENHKFAFLEPNYETMRCSLCVWKRGHGFAAFPGSTVPFGRSVKNRISKNGQGVNQIGRGRFKNYILGGHASSAYPTPHRALLQRCNVIVQRTGDDSDFDDKDRWEGGGNVPGFSHVGDNIHCARNMGNDYVGIPNVPYSSLGCSVIAGTVETNSKGKVVEAGPYAKFIDLVYRQNKQSSFEYIVWGGNEALSMSETKGKGKSVLLRFGSSGKLVSKLQKALIDHGYYNGAIDEDFGYGTFSAILGFQGNNAMAKDGIVGPDTAKALGFDLPDFTG